MQAVQQEGARGWVLQRRMMMMAAIGRWLDAAFS